MKRLQSASTFLSLFFFFFTILSPCLCCSQTVGVLTVVAASVSGVYRCVASNSAGADHLDHHFYVTGDPVISVFLIVKE